MRSVSFYCPWVLVFIPLPLFAPLVLSHTVRPLGSAARTPFVLAVQSIAHL
ncbi:hypothetical protein ACOSQ2_026187 [Xanthoceras sorbifolium]